MKMNEHEDKWWVELSGDDSEKQELTYLCSQPSCTLCSITQTDTIATEVSSVSTPEKAQYYLKSFRFAKLTNPEEVRIAAKKLLQTIKAVAKLHSKFGFQSISISGRVVGVGHNLEVQSFGSTPVVESRAMGIRAIATGLNQDTSIPKWYLYDSYRNQFSNWIEDSIIFETSSYFAEELSWDSLYKLYEMIKYDVDDKLDGDLSPNKCNITKYQWAGMGELKKFKNTANNIYAEGKPRHSSASYKELKRQQEAKQKNKKKSRILQGHKARNRRDPTQCLMKLAEANSLFKRVFKRWFETRLLKFQLQYANVVADYLSKTYNISVG